MGASRDLDELHALMRRVRLDARFFAGAAARLRQRPGCEWEAQRLESFATDSFDRCKFIEGMIAQREAADYCDRCERYLSDAENHRCPRVPPSQEDRAAYAEQLAELGA